MLKPALTKHGNNIEVKIKPDCEQNGPILGILNIGVIHHLQSDVVETETLDMSL